MSCRPSCSEVQKAPHPGIPSSIVAVANVTVAYHADGRMWLPAQIEHITSGVTVASDLQKRSSAQR
jgi:hypothetical protein